MSVRVRHFKALAVLQGFGTERSFAKGGKVINHRSTKMGNMIVRTWDNFWYPELNPVPYGPVTFDPFFGIGPRKERVMIATEEELRACKIPKDKWDFCAHTLLEVERCRADHFPFLWRCREQAHAASMCNYQDYLLRMKEYERERRLLRRKHRIEQAQAQGA